MSPDIDAVNKLLKEEKIWQVVRTHMEQYHMSQGRNKRCLQFPGPVICLFYLKFESIRVDSSVDI